MSKKYEINIQNDPELTKLVRSLASKNAQTLAEAQEAVAAFIQVVALEVIAQAPTIGNLFRTISYEKGTAPYIPLDAYYDVRDRNYLQIWQSSAPGGLATNFVKGLARFVADTYDLSSAISIFKEDAAGGRVDILASTIERLAQEFLIYHDTVSAQVLLAALGQARYTNLAGAQAAQGIRVATADTFQLDDMNRVITLLQRMRPSWVGGTPVGGQTISHLVGSPEFHEELRSIAYQPQNTRNGATTTSGATSLSAPDDVRESVFNAAGNASFYGVDLINLYEMGVGQPYNTIFSTYIGATAIDGGAAFNPAIEEVVLALSLNTNKNSLIRIVERSVTDGSTLNVEVDDQFTVRSKKLGWFVEQREGRVVTDSRNLGFLVM